MHALHSAQSLQLMAATFPDWSDVTDDRGRGAGQRTLLWACRALLRPPSSARWLSQPPFHQYAGSLGTFPVEMDIGVEASQVSA